MLRIMGRQARQDVPGVLHRGMGSMNLSKRMILIFVVLFLCVGCDQATKSIAVSVLPQTRIFSYFGDTLRFHLAYNQGAFLSLGSSLPEGWRHAIFTVGMGFFLAGALAFGLFIRPRRFSVLLAISLFLAGGIGNLIDRIVHHGSVVDFINIGLGSLRTGIFNIADVDIIVGIVILFMAAMRRRKEDR